MEYKQWLASHNQWLNDRFKEIEDVVTKHRKTKKSLGTKQRNAKKVRMHSVKKYICTHRRSFGHFFMIKCEYPGVLATLFYGQCCFGVAISSKALLLQRLCHGNKVENVLQ